MDPIPKITRVKMGTVGATELATVESWYGDWLGYRVIERGVVAQSLANSWGAPAMAGRAFILMEPESGADVYIRAIEMDSVAGYKPLTTYGWNSFEIIVKDVDALNERLKQSPFEIIGPPRSLGGEIASIHAMQVIGPAQEVLYLTCETNPRPESLLPDPGAAVGRNFISVVSGPDLDALQAFYSGKFNMERGEPRETTIDIIARAMGLPAENVFNMSFAMFAEAGNFIEMDCYPSPATERPRNPGELPPGNAIFSFSVNTLDDLDIEFISDPVRDASTAHGGNRSAAFVGPAGEIAELIEEAR